VLVLLAQPLHLGLERRLAAWVHLEGLQPLDLFLIVGMPPVQAVHLRCGDSPRVGRAIVGGVDERLRRGLLHGRRGARERVGP
jgi:hypothetical protein